MNRQAVNVLLVEDNTGDVRLVQEMLLQANTNRLDNEFNLTSVGQLDHALTSLNQKQTDLILLDLSLPDSQGLGTLHQMLEAAPELPVVVLSGLGDEVVAFEAVKAGAQNYLVKGYINEFSLPRDILYAIERKQIEKQMQRRNRELTLLNKIIAASTTSSESHEILQTACTELAKTFDLPLASAFLFGEDNLSVAVVAQYQDEAWPSMLGKRIYVGDTPLLQRLLHHAGPLVISNVYDEPGLTPVYPLLQQYGIVSLLVLPIQIGEKVIGSLSLAATELCSFSSEEIELAWSVTDQVAGVLARVRLNEERQLLSMAVEKTAESIIITDAQGTILYVNPAFEQVTGYTRVDVVGNNPRLLKSGQQADTFYQELWATITAGQVWHGQFINRKKDGVLYTVEATITPVQDAEGQIINYVAVQRDVTWELQREEQYRQSQKMEAIGQLAGGIAHDFNNLLTVITGYSELLLQRRVSPDNPIAQDLAEIKKAGERAAGLTRQLLAFSRKQVLQPEILDLNYIITDLGKMLKRLIGEDIDLITVPEQNLGRIKADPGQMEQIIMNIAVNARDAMPHGGKLTIETANIYLDEAYVSQHADIEPGWYVLLAITDTGTGMNVETRAKIFEPFFTTKEQGKGTGLGLATVYGIVKQSGGHIWVYSELEQGTTFKIYLPQIEPITEAVRELHLTAAPQRGSETILVVEDEQMVRELTYHTLHDMGYTVLQAGNGPEAIQLCQTYQEPIHLLLTDVVMPGEMSGRQLTDHLVSLRAHMKVLYMSGYPDSSIVHRGVLAEGTAFLQKPFTPRSLAHKVRAVLDTPSS